MLLMLVCSAGADEVELRRQLLTHGREICMHTDERFTVVVRRAQASCGRLSSATRIIQESDIIMRAHSCVANCEGREDQAIAPI